MDRDAVHGVDEFGRVDFGAQSLRMGDLMDGDRKWAQRALTGLGIGLLCLVGLLAAMAAGCL